MKPSPTKPFSIPRDQFNFAALRVRPVIDRAMHDAVWMDAPLSRIGVVCYLQGVNDAVQLIEDRGWPPWKEQDPEYFI